MEHSYDPTLLPNTQENAITILINKKCALYCALGKYNIM